MTKRSTTKKPDCEVRVHRADDGVLLYDRISLRKWMRTDQGARGSNLDRVVAFYHEQLTKHHAIQVEHMTKGVFDLFFKDVLCPICGKHFQ